MKRRLDGGHVSSLYNPQEDLRRHRENTIELILGTLVILTGIAIGLFVILPGGQG